jgi:hypothetical protein
MWEFRAFFRFFYAYLVLLSPLSLGAIFLTDVQFKEGDLTDTIIICLSKQSTCLYSPTPFYPNDTEEKVFEFFLPEVTLTPASRSVIKKLKERKIEGFSLDFLAVNGVCSGLKIVLKVDEQKLSWFYRTDTALGGRAIGFFFTHKEELGRIKSSAHGLRWVA